MQNIAVGKLPYRIDWGAVPLGRSKSSPTQEWHDGSFVMDLQEISKFMTPAQRRIHRYDNGSRTTLTLLEVVVASFLVGAFLSLMVAC